MLEVIGLTPEAVETLFALKGPKVGDEIQFRRSPSYYSSGHVDWQDGRWLRITSIDRHDIEEITSASWSDHPTVYPVVCSAEHHLMSTFNITGWRRMCHDRT